MNVPLKRPEIQPDLFAEPESVLSQAPELPDKDASRAEVYDYACHRYQGDRKRAESFTKGWFQRSWQSEHND